MSLENAPKHIKLAVDLIQLLEENQMPTETVVKAFVDGATLTPKGALTYWYNCRRKLQKEKAKSTQNK
ncbi:MAG: hypothetical protein COA76_17410 [Moritella sp.]|nr:MAG: hypothetical protein COA76_17410 [Moritella sp.]